MNPPSQSFEHLDDESFLAEMREFVRVSDPVPTEVLEYARLAPSLIPMNVGLAELVASEELSGVRDSSDAMEFSLGHGGVRVLIHSDVVSGEFDEPGWSVSVHYKLFHRDIAVDGQTFSFVPEAATFSLKFCSPSGELSATEWLAL